MQSVNPASLAPFLSAGAEAQSTRFVALDTETTGFDPQADRIVEIAILEFDPGTGAPGRHLRTLIDPCRPIPAQSTAIHGIGDADVANAPRFETVLPDILAFVAGATCVIHNANFDTRMLTAELKRLGRPAFSDCVGELIDTLKLARQVLPGRRHNLDALCEAFQIDRSRRTLHGALVDCELLAGVYPHLAQGLARLSATLSSLLPFEIGDEVPEEVEAAALRWLMLNDLVDVLAREQGRLHAAVKARLAGVGCAGRNWSVEFNPSCTTDWKRIAAQYLNGIDLEPYRKTTSEMRIRWRSD